MATRMTKLGAEDRQRLVRVGRRLVIATLAYNIIEAVASIWEGSRAGSIALVGFGLDSVIESAAAGVLLWRLSIEAQGAAPEAVESAERRVRRFVGITFFALAAYVLLQGGWTLWQRVPPEESRFGIAIAVASLIIMPAVSIAKIRVARRIGSGALLAEAKETLACSYLSFALLLGLVANVTVGWWWADPVAALLMTPWLIREGLEGVHGEGCCAHD